MVWCATTSYQSHNAFLEIINALGPKMETYLRKYGHIIDTPLKWEIDFSPIAEQQLGKPGYGGTVVFEYPTEYPKRPGTTIYKGTVDRDTGHFYFPLPSMEAERVAEWPRQSPTEEPEQH